MVGVSNGSCPPSDGNRQLTFWSVFRLLGVCEAQPMNATLTSSQSPPVRAGAPSYERVIRAGLLLALTAVVALIATQSIDFGFYDLRIAALDSDVHASLFGIISLGAQAAAATAMALRGANSSRRGPWLALAGLVTVLLALRATIAYDAGLLLAPVAVVFLLCWRLTSDDPPRVRALVRGALFLLVFSFVAHAVALKIVTALGYGYNSWPYELKGMLKHTTEMAGWMLLATGILAGTRGRLGDLRFRGWSLG